VVSQRTINKWQRDIEHIDRTLFPIEDRDDLARLYLLQIKRDHLVRSLVIEIHLAIESLLDTGIRSALLEGRSAHGKLVRAAGSKALFSLLEGNRPIGFPHKLLLARALGS